jgi:hypothetical protein
VAVLCLLLDLALSVHQATLHTISHSLVSLDVSIQASLADEDWLFVFGAMNAITQVVDPVFQNLDRLGFRMVLPAIKALD